MFIRRSVLGERPGQHELGLKHCVGILDHVVEGRGHPAIDWVLDPALDVGNAAPRIALVPSPVQRLGSDAQLDNQIV